MPLKPTACIGLIATLILVVFTFFAILFWSHLSFIYHDSFCFPYTFAPKMVQNSISPFLREDESVLTINMDAFDYEHINVLTTQRILSLHSTGSKAPDAAFELSDIQNLKILDSDPRFVLIIAKNEHAEKLFFVGGGRNQFIRKAKRAMRNLPDISLQTDAAKRRAPEAGRWH